MSSKAKKKTQTPKPPQPETFVAEKGIKPEPLPFEVPAAGLFIGRHTIHRRAEPVWHDPDAYGNAYGKSNVTSATTRMHLVTNGSPHQDVVLARIEKQRRGWRHLWSRSWVILPGQFPEFNAYLTASLDIYYPKGFAHTTVSKMQAVVMHFWHQYLSCMRYTVMNIHALPKGQAELYQPATVVRHMWEGVRVETRPDGSRVWRHERMASEPEPPPSLRIVRDAKVKAVRDQDFELASRIRDIEGEMLALMEEKGPLNFEVDATPFVTRMWKILKEHKDAKTKRSVTEGEVVEFLAKTYKVVGDAVKLVDKEEKP